MNPKNLFKILAVIAVATSLATASTLTHAADSKDKAPQLKLSPKVGDALQAAVKAIEAKKFDVAAEKLKTADAVSKKTEFDEFQITDIKAQLAFKQDNLTEALPLFEKTAERADFLQGDAYPSRLRFLIGLSYKAKQVDKSVVYAKRLTELQPDDKTGLLLLGQLQYEQKQIADARVTYEKLINLAENKGEKPDQIWLELVQFCADDAGDKEGVLKATEKLVLHYANTKYWTQISNLYEQYDHSDPYNLNLMRFRMSVDIMTKDDYLEYAQLAIDDAMPGEAVKVLKQAYDRKVLGAEGRDKGLHGEVLSKATKNAAADQALIPTYEKDAAKSNKDGKADVNVGLAYFSFDNFDKAAASLDKGLKAGGIKDADAIRMVLGIALLNSGAKEKARAEFQAVAAGNTVLNRMAKLWDLRARVAN